MILHQPIFERLISEVEAGRRAALCAVVAKRGSTPQVPGAMMLLGEDRTAVGTIGGGSFEAETRRRAFELLDSGDSKLFTLQAEEGFGGDDASVCGGVMDVAVMPVSGSGEVDQFRQVLADLAGGRSAQVHLRVEREGRLQEYRVLVEAEPKLVIAGAGHVGAEVARRCVPLEFDVTVIDDRAEMLDAGRLPPPIHTVAGDIEQTLRRHPIDRNSYVIIVTRGHKHDERALAAVIDRPVKYLGMIGSRRKIKTLFDNLQAAGVTRTQLDRVHAPIGLDIHAVTVPELGVSIAAELIAIRRADHRRLVEGPFPVKQEGVA